LNGLVFLHSHDMIHYNLKASNVLVDDSGNIKISDYIEFNILSGNDSGKMVNFATNNMKGNYIFM
jgi:serine/threonine protein kinase